MQLSHALQVGQGTEYAKELCKWEANYTQYGPPGRPYEYRAYPSAMYKAKRPAKGGDPLFDFASAEDERDRERLERVGYVYGGKAAALAALERQEFEIAELAANRHLTDRRMGEQARAEAAAADEATIQHLAAIPETPIKKRRGRKPKAIVTE